MNKGRKSTSRRIRVSIVGIAATVIGITLILLATGTNVKPAQGKSSSTSAGGGCITHDDAFETFPGDVVTIRATVAFTECPQVLDIKAYVLPPEEQSADVEALTRALAEVPTDSKRHDEIIQLYSTETANRQAAKFAEAVALSKQRLVGGTARLSLGSELFEGRISGADNVDQKIESPDSKGTWTWQLSPAEPGQHELPLVLTVVDSENKEVKFRDDHFRVRLNVAPTLSYRAGAAASAVSGFITSLAGAVTGIVAIIGGTATVAATTRRRRTVSKNAETNPNDTSGSDGGSVASRGYI